MSPRHRPVPRMEDVARLAGVAPITVSRALSEPGKVAAATRARILQAIDETGYLPNRVAGGLASRRTRVVGAVIPTVTNSIFADTVHGMTEGLAARGFQLLLNASGQSIARETELIRALLAQRPAGLILTGKAHAPEALAMLQRAAIPVVGIWRHPGGGIDMIVGL
jgi:LacI family transcriptional regulator, gluconate utilization system Gnt-I transcriptional repressor